MTGLSMGHVLLPSLAGCMYFYYCDPRGHVIVLAALLTHAALALQDYLSTGHVLSAVLHASLVLTAQILFIILVTVLYRLSPLHPLSKFPGPTLVKITGLKLAYLAFTGKRAEYVAKLHDKYGVIVRIGPNKLSINSSDAILPLYASSQAFDKAVSYRPGGATESLFFMRGKGEHGRRRRIWAGALSAAATQQWDERLKTRTDQLIECIARRQYSGRGTVDLNHCFDHWAFDFCGDLTFGTGCSRIEFMKEGDPEQVVRNAQEAIVILETFGEVPALFDAIMWMPVYYSALERVAAKHFKERIKINSPNGMDLCSFFLGQREAHQYAPLNDADINADIVLAFEAGGDTIAGFLSVTMFYLLRYPETYKKLKQELDQAFPTGEIAADQHASLGELPYLGAVVNEGLRFGSGFPGFPRVVPKGGAMLEGQFVPEGTIVGVPTYAQHISPENYWPTPREFKPERWFKDGLGPGTIARQSTLMAFQFGPFGCAGKILALRQMNIVLAYTILAYDLSFALDFDLETFMKGWTNTRTNILKYPLKVQAKRRQH